MNNLNLFAIGGISLAISCILLVAINLIFGRKKVHIVWSLFNISVAIWGFGAFKVATTTIPEQAWFWWKINHTGVIWMPVFILHTAYFLTTKISKKVLVFSYLQAIVFQVIELLPTSLFFQNLRLLPSSFYYVTLGVTYHPFFVMWLLLVVYAHLGVFKEYRNSSGFKRHSLLYFLIGSALGFAGGLTNFLIGYKFDIIPIGNFTIPIYCVMVTYAIIKYRLMDIRIALTRAAILFFVYALVLGLPLLIGYRTKSWFLATFSMFALASIGPIIYNYLREKSETIILQDQIRYQKALKDFSSTLIFVKDLNELSQKVVAEIMKAIDLQYCALYLRQDSNFQLKYHQAKDSLKLPKEVSLDSEWIEKVKEARGPVLGEHIPKLENMQIGLILSLFFNKELYGFILLGHKTKGFFTDTDLDIFNIVASQTSLAFSEIFYFKAYQRESEQRHSIELEKARLQSAFEISEAYRHELGNILNIISTSLGNLMFIGDSVPTKEEIEQTRIAINNNVKRGNKIFSAISKYNENSYSQYKPARLEQLLKAVINEQQEQLTTSNITLKADIGENIRILANDNFIYALRYLLEGAISAIDYLNPQQKLIAISLENKDTIARLIISDTGQDATSDKIYTGVGIERAKEGGILYFIARRIIFDNRGTFQMASLADAKGTSFIIEIPLLKGGGA